MNISIVGRILKEASTDCRSETGVTVGLIDGIISMARVLVKRDLSPEEVSEALDDLHDDEDIASILDDKDGL